MKKQVFMQPNRQLSANFTDSTLRQAIKAKRRHNRPSPIQGFTTMKQRNFFKQPAGALIAFAVVLFGGAGTYAAVNWFGGSVKVSTNQSIMSVDLSQCQGNNLPPGIEPTTDPRNVKFKILGSPHISEADLQRALLADCEFKTIQQIYYKPYGATIASYVGVVRDIQVGARTITLDVTYGGQQLEKTFSVAPDAAIYDKGVTTKLSNIKSGDFVTFAYNRDTPVNENENPFDQTLEIKCIFKTQHDLRETVKHGKTLYSANNIMPLEQYEELMSK